MISWVMGGGTPCPVGSLLFSSLSLCPSMYIRVLSLSCFHSQINKSLKKILIYFPITISFLIDSKKKKKRVCPCKLRLAKVYFSEEQLYLTFYLELLFIL